MRLDLPREHPLDRSIRVRSTGWYGEREKVFRVILNAREYVFDADGSMRLADGYKVASGKRGRYYFRENPVTWLITCQACGKRSTPRKVQYRPAAAGWDHLGEKNLTGPSKAVLCMSCWNKARQWVKAYDESVEVLRLKRSIERKINESAKNNAAIA